MFVAGYRRGEQIQLGDIFSSLGEKATKAKRYFSEVDIFWALTEGGSWLGSFGAESRVGRERMGIA